MNETQIKPARNLASNLGGFKNKRHGHMCGHKATPEYECWLGLKKRCLNPKCQDFARYGGRGIKVCERWLKFENFLEDMGLKPSPAHTIERIDNDTGYSKENCKWATLKEQRRNTSKVHFITFNGITLCLADWADRIGMKRLTLQMRILRGWSVEDALTRDLRPPR
jgi:hypothetical protein